MREEKFRCHPSIILEKTATIITFLFLLFMTSGDDITYLLKEGQILNALFITLGLVGIISIVLIYNIVIWSKTYIEIEENTIVIQRNTISSKINTYGIKNISNINLEQNIFESILNTYKVKIDTDTSSSADSTDIEIVLSKKDAYEFKYKVLSLINEEKTNTENEDTPYEIQAEYMEDYMDYDMVYSTKDILKHCLYSLSIGKLIVNIFLIGITLFVAYTDDGSIMQILFFVGMVLFYIVKFLLGDLFKYYKLSIKREEDKLHISCGLLKKRKFTVPVKRINAINITQPTISRMFKLYQSEIVTIGVGDDDSESSKIILASKKEDLILSMKKLLPEINVEEVLELEKQPKKICLISLVNIVLWTIGIAFVSFVLNKIFDVLPIKLLILVIASIFIMMCLCAYLSYITKGINLGVDNISMSWGIFSKKYSTVQYEKIQHVLLSENPISTKVDLCKGSIFILANTINTVRSMGYYDKDLYENLNDKIINSK